MTANSALERPESGVACTVGLDTDAALLAIQEAVNAVTGKRVPIEASTRMDEYFKAVGGTDELDYLDLSFRLERRLGLWISKDDWSFLTGGLLCHSYEEWAVKYAPFFTFGRLAELLAVRARLGRFEPVTLLGSTSRAAGAFRRIEEITKDIDPRIRTFAPSTAIQDRVSGDRLQTLWGRLRAMAGNRLPPLQKSGLKKTLDAVFSGLHGAVAGLVLYAILAWLSYQVLAASTGILRAAAYLAGITPVLILHLLNRGLPIVAKWSGYPMQVLPHDIRTFRDLAELIAGDRGGWCEKCSYDLTGLQSNRCPECGVDQRVAPIPPKWNAGPSAEVA